ncbi:MAG: UDP-N-acetylglucosamine 2-epimerase (non-hydrolyzing) [bacterium]|nr:UDP-N-acetylglucosamine 2-epimerase (non-hydrolyzing) [bacterium]
MKTLFIFGTRPEAIKLAPLILKYKKHYPSSTFVCVSAQHRQLLDQVLTFFSIQPDFDLNLMKPNQTLSELTANIISALTPVITEVKPDVVFVQGDTTTVFAGALCAFYNQTKVVHIEAGLRSGNKYSPFPEEINRELTSKLSDFHFTPTALASANLEKEGIKKNIFQVGNTVIDALIIAKEKVYNEDNFYQAFFSNINFSKKIILVTCHRRESFGEGINNIFSAIREIALTHPDVEIIYPVHPNPNVKLEAEKQLSDIGNVNLIAPLDYPYLVWLLTKVNIVLTDSGGLQEEAPTFGKPVLVLREVTERVEGIEAGTAKLVGNNKTTIVNEVNLLLTNEIKYKEMANAINPYGDGLTSQRIFEILEKLI